MVNFRVADFKIPEKIDDFPALKRVSVSLHLNETIMGKSIHRLSVIDTGPLWAASHNVLPMDAETFRIWAKLMHRRSDTLYEDAMIAATAVRHQLTVVTRKGADFSAFGVQLLNPFEPPV